MHKNNLQLIKLATASKLPSHVLARYMDVSTSTYYGYRCEADSERYSSVPDLRLKTLKDELLTRNFITEERILLIENECNQEKAAA